MGRIQDSLYEGAPTIQGRQHMILSEFPKKCMKSRKFWAGRRGALGAALRSASDYQFLILKSLRQNDRVYFIKVFFCISLSTPFVVITLASLVTCDQKHTVCEPAICKLHSYQKLKIVLINFEHSYIIFLNCRPSSEHVATFDFPVWNGLRT